MHIQHDPSATVTRRRTTSCTPLLDLLRTALAERGSVTLRALPAGDDLVQVDPRDDAILLADDQDDARLLTSLIYGLHYLGLGDADPRLDDSVTWFVSDATRRTVAAMGLVAR